LTINAQTTYKTSDGTTFSSWYDAQRHQAKIDARAAEKDKEEKEKAEKARKEGNTYEPGSGYKTSTRVWREETLAIDYRSNAKKAKAKEINGLSFNYPKDKGVEVTHNKTGISAYDNSVFHNHDNKKTGSNTYNNFLYELDFSFHPKSTKDFGFGFQFIGKNDSFHDCDDHTFFSFVITAGNKLIYYKKKMGINDKFTSGFFPELKDDIPEMFNLDEYKTIRETITLREINHLFVSQWKNELVISINNVTIYKDALSRCPVMLQKTPYNLFLNTGTVTFFNGEEIYIEKKH
jgi:hypothetical protein